MPKLDLSPILSGLVIRDKTAHVVPFSPNWAQRQMIAKVEQDYAEGIPTRHIYLKARQLGISTCVQLMLFSMGVAFDNTNAVVVAHRADSSETLFGISKLAYESWALRGEFPARYSTRRELVLHHQNSSLRVMTAEKKDSGRGRTLNHLHCSELAFWREPLETMVGFAQSIPQIPGTSIFIESTANGIGNFFEEMWNEAVDGENGYTPFFFPWFTHHEYIPCFGITCKDGTCETCQRQTKGLQPRDGDEKELARLGASPAHLAWRRYAVPTLCWGDQDLFMQEYPHTAEAAFISKGVNAFNPKALKEVFEPAEFEQGRLVKGAQLGEVKFIRDPAGPLRMYKKPARSQAGQYFIGADPCNGTYDGDYAAAQVLNRHTKEQVAVWHGRINPIPFAEELAKLGTYYNQAIISPDVMGGGAATLGALTHLYPRIWQHRYPDKWPGENRSKALGFLASWQRKQWMVAQLADQVERGAITIHDKQTFQEMKAYVFYGGQGEQYGPAQSGQHDDLVSALAICILCESTEDPIEPLERQRPEFTQDGKMYAPPLEDEAREEVVAW